MNTLEATLDERDERIEEFKAEIERLSDADSAQPKRPDALDDDGHPEAIDDEGKSETTSLWGRTMRLLETGSE